MSRPSGGRGAPSGHSDWLVENFHSGGGWETALHAGRDVISHPLTEEVERVNTQVCEVSLCQPLVGEAQSRDNQKKRNFLIFS